MKMRAVTFKGRREHAVLYSKSIEKSCRFVGRAQAQGKSGAARSQSTAIRRSCRALLGARSGIQVHEDLHQALRCFRAIRTSP